MRRRSFVILATLFALVYCSRHSETDHAHDTVATTTTTTATEPAAHAGQLVQFGEASGYLAPPKNAAAKNPALIVIHEWWGLDGWIREQTDRFAGQGYVALAPDLYRGKATSDPAVAHELMRGMPEDRAMADLRAAFQYLASREDVDPARIGVIGWCMGGGYALALATSESRVAATVINYGRLVTDETVFPKISGPILGNFGSADRGIPVEDVREFERNLTRHGKLGDIKIYEGAGHGFMNANHKEGYDEGATRDAWNRIDGFFARTLRDKIPNS